MTQVLLRPDLKTAGGEVSDIIFNNRFVGTLTLVYRENARIAGALQLEKEVLSEREKDEVFDVVHSYVQAFVDAVQAHSCEVMVTYSSYDHVIATEREGMYEAVSEAEDFEYDTDWVDTDTRLEDENALIRDEYSLADFELTVVGEDNDTIEYQIYDKDEDLIAEALIRMDDRDLFGEVHWLIEPLDNELDVVADLLVLDFDDDQIDTMVLHMLFHGDIIETIELTHETLLDASDDEEEALFAANVYERDDYSITLARDDGDVLTYEIYQQSHGGLPIGSATVDISQRQLTGFIDFREPGSESDRELIATLLMEELDKEKDYEQINLAMMHRNRVIEEVLFESETVH